MISPMFELYIWTGLIIFVLTLFVIIGIYIKLYRSLKKDYTEQVIKNSRLQAELKEKSLSSKSVYGKATSIDKDSGSSKAATEDYNPGLQRFTHDSSENYLLQSIN